MTEIRVDSIVDSSGSGPVDFEEGTFKIKGTSLGSLNLHKFLDSDTAPADSSGDLSVDASRRYNGLMWYDSDNTRLNIMTPIGWRTFNANQVPDPPSEAGDYYGDTGAHITGNSGNTIEQFVISTAGNATSLGTMGTSGNQDFSAVSGETGSRCVVIYGNHGGSRTGRMEHFTFATGGTATNLGNIGRGSYGGSATSDGSRAVYTWGHDFESYNAPISSNIRYFTIGTSFSTYSFGSLTRAISYQNQGVISDGTKGCFAAGYTSWPNWYNDIEYLTIQTTSNTSDLGDLTQARWAAGGLCDTTYGLVAGGWSSPGRVDTIDYFTIATTGNATDFGNMTQAKDYMCATNNKTKGCLTGGYFYNASASPNQGAVTEIDYVTIQTPGNATDFGDLATASQRGASSSGT